MKTFVQLFNPGTRSLLLPLACAAACIFMETARADTADEIRIRRKMDGILLECIEYRQANIVDVIDELSDLAREYDENEPDRKKKGINFVLDIGSDPPSDDEDDFWAVSSENGSIAGIPPITIMARHVSLKTALDLIVKEAGLEYRTIGNIVKISRKNTSDPGRDDAAHPLFSAKSFQVVRSFDAKRVRDPAQCKWYCYEPGKTALSERPVETTKLGFKREPKAGPVVLLFDPGSGTLLWKWIAAPPAKLFDDKDAANLGEICFGADPLVEDLWKRRHPEWDHRYKLSSKLLSTEVYGGDVTRLEKAMEWAQDEWEYKRTPEFDKILSDLNDLRYRLEMVEIELDSVDDRISDLNSRIDIAIEKDRRKRQSGKIEYAGGNMFSESEKLRRKRSDLESKKWSLLKEKDSLSSSIRKSETKRDQILEAYTRFGEKDALEAAIREMEFTVSVVLKGEDKR